MRHSLRNTPRPPTPVVIALLLMSAALLLAACSTNRIGDLDDSGESSAVGGSRVAQDGDRVSVHYRGTLEDGEEFDSSFDRGEPLSFTVGLGEMIPGFENAVRGMIVGETKTVQLTPSDAYGERRPELIIEVPRSEAPGDGFSVGDRVLLANGSPATITEITDEIVRLDGNHELAGLTLTFAITLVSVE